MSSSMAPIPQNYIKNVDWILRAYIDAGVTFPNGFQKDAIQNAVGARKTNKWKNWTCDISLKETKQGAFLVVEDSGTVGLTGNNIPTEEITKKMQNGEEIAPYERLSRFTSMFNSGGNKTGGGLFGAGKSVYSVASKKYKYYFDSLREDGSYVANVNESGHVMPIALEGKKAKDYILRETGLPEKTKVGTRVIIVDPVEELVESIKDKSIIQFIQESWWLIIQRFDETSSITVNGFVVPVPEGVKDGTHVFELQRPERVTSNYQVKHFGLYFFAKGGNGWKGISYFRKGMKIGEVSIKDIPEKLKDKYWGYVEVDEAWEDELSEIEDTVHFGVSKGKKNSGQYQKLQNFCTEKTNAKFKEWGFIRDKEIEDKKLKDELNGIAEDLQDLFDRLGYEDLGKGPNKTDFDVRWQDISYPVKNSEQVTSDDEIKFSIRIKSGYASDKKFEYKLYVLDPSTGDIVSSIRNDSITIKSNTVEKVDFIHKVTKDNSVQFAENRIILSVKVNGSGKEKKKELPYFFDVERPETHRESVTLSLHECLFPIAGSRRVNFDESIRKVCYKIENKHNYELSYKLNVSVHNASDLTCPKIVDITSYTGTVKPFEDVITPYIEEIVFEKSVYEQYLSKGVLELRARLIAVEFDDQYEKGDKITSYHYKIFLNSDEKNGKADAFEIQSVSNPDNYKRSWCNPGSRRTIVVNVGHAAYLRFQDFPEIQHEYLREQMLKQYVLLYLGEGKYDMFRQNGRDFSELEPQEAVDLVLEKIESIYAQSLK